MMIEIEYKENLDEKFFDIIDTEFNKFAEKNGVTCNYEPFNFIAKDQDKVIGIITGHSYYKEVHIGDLIILEEYRNKQIGSKLVQVVENYYKDKIFSQKIFIKFRIFFIFSYKFYFKSTFLIKLWCLKTISS